MNSHGDTPNLIGCLQLIITGILAAAAGLFLLCSCKSTPPTFNADVRTSDGKLAAHITGTYDPGKSWVERNLGPLGVLLGAAGAILQAAIPVAAVP